MAKRYIGDSNAQMYSNLMPAGTVLPFAGSTAPTGWLLCDGTSKATASYPELQAAIGYTYGGSGANFNVPDCRGIFISGTGSQAISGITYTRTHGAKQGDAIQGHKHAATTTYQYVSSDKPGSGFGASGSYAASDNGVTVNNPTTDGSNGTPRTAAETRPANIAMNYIIKY